MVTNELVEKLRSLKVFPDTAESPNSVQTNAEIFEKCKTLDEIRLEIVNNHNWGCGCGQFVYFHLDALLKKELEYNSEFLEEAKEKLKDFGIALDHIEEYFTFGQQPGLLISLKYDSLYSKEVRMNFFEHADQFALDKLRQWMDFN